MPGTVLGMPLPLDDPLDPAGELEPLCPEELEEGLLCPGEPEEDEGEPELCDEGELLGGLLLGELLLGDGMLGEGMLGELGGGELLLEEQPASASAVPSRTMGANWLKFRLRRLFVGVRTVMRSAPWGSRAEIAWFSAGRCPACLPETCPACLPERCPAEAKV